MKTTNITSSFSNREKMRRKSLSRRNRHAISSRRLYISRVHSLGAIRSAPSNRMDKSWGPQVKAVAEEISRELGYRPGVKAA